LTLIKFWGLEKIIAKIARKTLDNEYGKCYNND
jgi:hypothetical protein